MHLLKSAARRIKSISQRKFLNRAESIAYPDVSSLRAQALPTEYWIELTSKCPFDCVFCSRAMLRGKGEHMDFQLYKSLIAQMRDPALIRLNYSGESIHYPDLSEAIALAKATGARVELVTALSSAKSNVIEALVREKLDRLTVSIHALEEGLYQSIYGFGSVSGLHENLALLQEYKRAYSSSKPSLDFAFVAMDRNLSQLEQVALLAEKMGVQQIDIHPVIRRDEISDEFTEELIAGNLTASFRHRMAMVLDWVREHYPQVSLNISSKELDTSHCMSELPVVFPVDLPAGARIFSCEQNPWATIHVLANGDLVTCEVRDQMAMGNLTSNTLADIWRSETYNNFRRNYEAGNDEKCRTCIYKQAYQPSVNLLLNSYLTPKECPHQLLQGWHPPESDIVWSAARNSRAILACPAHVSAIQIKGILPPDEVTLGRSLTINVGRQHKQVTNATKTMLDFVVEIPWDASVNNVIAIDFQVSALYWPEQTDGCADARPLGFVLLEIICR